MKFIIALLLPLLAEASLRGNVVTGRALDDADSERHLIMQTGSRGEDDGVLIQSGGQRTPQTTLTDILTEEEEDEEDQGVLLQAGVRPKTVVEDVPGCEIEVEVKCFIVPPPAAERRLIMQNGVRPVKPVSCDEALSKHEPIACEKEPTALEFKFAGGRCESSKHSQEDFFCKDFGDEGDVTDSETVNYIEVMSPRKVGALYFEGSLSVGETFVVKKGGVDEEGGDRKDRRHLIMQNGVRGGEPLDEEPLDGELMVLTYADDSKEELLQILLFHTECNGDLSLGDKYGSLHLMAFTNGDTSADMYMDLQFEVSIANVGKGQIHIEHVQTILDQDSKDLLDDGQILKLAAGDEESIVEGVTIDVMHPRIIESSATISRRDKGGNDCASFAVMTLKVQG